MERDKIFISYSRRDGKWLDDIKQFLVPLIRERIDAWDDSRIPPGANWFDEIQKAVESARVAVLLVSQTFLASDFINKFELPKLLEAGHRGELTVIWIPVSASSYKHTTVSELQAVIDPNRPLDTLSSAKRNQALVAVGEAIVQAMELQPLAQQGTRSLVLLYKRWSEIDEEAVQLLDAEFRNHGVRVFIDRHLPAGVAWGKRLAEEIRAADAVIPLLSTSSINSEMLSREVAIATECAQEQDGRPRMLPVRLAFRGKLPPQLELLNSIQHVEWESPEDNVRVVKQLMEGMKNGPQQSPLGARQAEGVMPSDDGFYVTRKTDTDLESAIRGGASIITIKGARQMGGSILLARGLRQATLSGAKVVYTDFQRFNMAQLSTLNDMYRALAESIDESLELGAVFDQIWQPEKSPNWNLERYFKRHLLGAFTSRLVWGMDDVDQLFKYPYSGEFFGLLRAWHNDRRVRPDTPLARLTMVIAYATEPDLGLDQSPFNIGISLRLQDFTIDQVGQMAYHYGALPTRADLERFYKVVGGHPYLVRRGLAELGNHNLDELLRIASKEDGPFGDHLRGILMTLAARPDLLHAVSTVLRGKPELTPEQFIRLRKAGIVSGDSHQDATMRCPLYDEYLKRHLTAAAAVAVR